MNARFRLAMDRRFGGTPRRMRPMQGSDTGTLGEQIDDASITAEIRLALLDQGPDLDPEPSVSIQALMQGASDACRKGRIGPCCGPLF